ncbi:DUF934 domain-containing protein [Allohahella marinimesophila]|uniref:DUF934 domain-containing protein n=1 Tax=Allohahella marinimesophila TaxID=1054972 RepID=A0ABP7NKR2_9GAMM
MPNLIKIPVRADHSEAKLVDHEWSRLEKDLSPEALGSQVEQALKSAYGVLVYWEDALAAGLEGAQVQHDLGLTADNFGVWFDSDDEVEALGKGAQQFPLIALHFPKFVDGRSYSSAYLLRSRFGFTGELRAVGDVLVDQLFFMRRCGFDAFELRADKLVEDALTALNAFSVKYQGSIDRSEPLFRIEDRPAASA